MSLINPTFCTSSPRMQRAGSRARDWPSPKITSTRQSNPTSDYDTNSFVRHCHLQRSHGRGCLIGRLARVPGISERFTHQTTIERRILNILGPARPGRQMKRPGLTVRARRSEHPRRWRAACDSGIRKEGAPQTNAIGLAWAVRRFVSLSRTPWAASVSRCKTLSEAYEPRFRRGWHILLGFGVRLPGCGLG